MSWNSAYVIQDFIRFLLGRDIITSRAQSETVDHGILRYVPVVCGDLLNKVNHCLTFACPDQTTNTIIDIS